MAARRDVPETVPARKARDRGRAVTRPRRGEEGPGRGRDGRAGRSRPARPRSGQGRRGGAAAAALQGGGGPTGSAAAERRAGRRPETRRRRARRGPDRPDGWRSGWRSDRPPRPPASHGAPPRGPHGEGRRRGRAPARAPRRAGRAKARSERSGWRGVVAARRQCSSPEAPASGLFLRTVQQRAQSADSALRSEATIEIVNRAAMTSSETSDGILYSSARVILVPTNTSTAERPIFR